MNSRKSKALELRVKDVLDPNFVREVLERKLRQDDSMRSQLLYSATSTTIVRNRIFAFADVTNPEMTLADLARHAPDELKRMARLGKKTMRWFETYLFLLGVVLPKTRSVYGMNEDVRAFLETL